jgi:hypothetical protein
MVDDSNVLVAGARVVRQRALIARLEARGIDTLEAKSMLSGLQYSLRLLKRRLRRRRTGSDAIKY